VIGRTRVDIPLRQKLVNQLRKAAGLKPRYTYNFPVPENLSEDDKEALAQRVKAYLESEGYIVHYRNKK
jgi:hypothetical protein